jgi:hypothetical protein
MVPKLPGLALTAQADPAETVSGFRSTISEAYFFSDFSSRLIFASVSG